MDDNLLVLGLQEFGYREVEQIRAHWLPKKHTNEIKHRYKNLTCSRVPNNIIKKWKSRHSQPLTASELYNFAKGVKWFGDSTNRWSLIQKCFLPERSPYYLKVEYYNKILLDFEKQERFGKLMLLDFEDHPHLHKLGSDDPLKLIMGSDELEVCEEEGK